MTEISGTNKVRADGRYKLPPDLADEYRGAHMAAYEDGSGKIVLERVEVGSK